MTLWRFYGFEIVLGEYEGDWTQKFSDVITERLGGYVCSIMFTIELIDSETTIFV